MGKSADRPVIKGKRAHFQLFPPFIYSIVPHGSCRYKCQLFRNLYCLSGKCLTGRASPASDNIRLFFSTCLKKGDGHGWSPSPPWKAGVCPKNIARGAQSSGGHAFSFFGMLSATLLCPQAINLCQEQIYKAAQLPNSQRQRRKKGSGSIQNQRFIETARSCN